MRPLVELLYVSDCPHHERARALIEEVAAELGVEPDLQLAQIAPVDVERVRFLGSPTIRVDGHDVEPGADASDRYVYACRVYEGAAGPVGVPDAEWVRRALRPHRRRTPKDAT